MLRSLLVLLLVASACKKESKPTGTTTTGSGSAMTGSDTMAGSGSATMTGSHSMAGSGSATTGSGAGSDTGSGAMGSGAGSDAAMGSGAGSGETEFDKLTHDQKVDFMKKKVMPPMKAAFQKFDAKEFKNFTCKTCHGKDPQKAKYKMPSPELPKLDFAKLKVGKQAPEMAEFMEKTVKPEMAKILGMPEYTPANPKGFGCLHCHEAVK